MSRLRLTRRPGEGIRVGDALEISVESVRDKVLTLAIVAGADRASLTLIAIEGRQVRLAVDAPRDRAIRRIGRAQPAASSTTDKPPRSNEP